MGLSDGKIFLYCSHHRTLIAAVLARCATLSDPKLVEGESKGDLRESSAQAR